jgi:hypothetical protein
VLLQQLLLLLHDEPQLTLKVCDALRYNSTRSLQARQLSRCGLQEAAAAAAAAAEQAHQATRVYEDLLRVASELFAAGSGSVLQREHHCRRTWLYMLLLLSSVSTLLLTSSAARYCQHKEPQCGCANVAPASIIPHNYPPVTPLFKQT